MGSPGCCQRIVGACSSSSSRDDRNPERTRKLAANHSLPCKTYLLLKWSTVAAGKGVWLILVHWSHVGKSKSPPVVVRWSHRQQTGTEWVLCMDPAQGSTGHGLPTWLWGSFKGVKSSSLHLLQDNWDPFRSYSYLSPCSKTSPNGIVPSQLESRATEHVSPDPREYLHFYWGLNPPKLCI